MKLDNLKPTVLYEYTDQLQSSFCAVYSAIAAQYFDLHEAQQA